MSKSQFDTGSVMAESAAIQQRMESGPRKLRQNIFLSLLGLYETPMMFLITVFEERDGSNIRLFRDANGGAFDGISRAEQVLSEEVLKLSETRPDDMLGRLKNEFGSVNVFLIPAGGFLAARLLTEGISVFCIFECGTDEF